MHGRFFSALALVCLIFALPTAAQAATPKKAKPSLSLTPVARGTADVRPLVTVAFPAPKGTVATKACSGKITFTAPVGKKTKTITKNGKKTKKTVVVYSKAGAKLADLAGICSATTAIKLPLTLIDKPVKFTASFPGNKQVKKFAKRLSLTLIEPSSPPPPPAPSIALPFTLQEGAWSYTTNSGAFGTFEIGPGNTLLPGSAREISAVMHCPEHLDTTPPNSVSESFDPPFAITKNFTALRKWVAAPQNMTSTFVFDFTSATTGVGTLSITGTLYAAPVPAVGTPLDLVPGCTSDSMTFTATAGAVM